MLNESCNIIWGETKQMEEKPENNLNFKKIVNPLPQKLQSLLNVMLLVKFEAFCCY